MRHRHFISRTLIALVTCVFVTGPAAAQWTRVTALPVADVYSLAQQGDTLLAGVDDAVFVSTDGGVNWVRTANVGPPPKFIESVWVERGRLWAGTYGQGVWTSADMGITWQDATAGLAGGLFDSHLYIIDIESRGDSLYAGTGGAGTFVKHLRTLGPWTVFGPSIVSSASGSVTDLARDGQRLMAAASGNGVVFWNDRGEPEWTESLLEPVNQGVGLQTWSFAWTGSAWLASTDTRVYRSTNGVDHWEQVGPAVGARTDSRVVSGGGRTFTAFNGAGVVLHFSPDGGTTWQVLESLPTIAYDLMLHGTDLYAARLDGLWRRSVATLDARPPAAPRAVEFALAGPHPVRGRTALRLALPSTGRVRVTAHDLAGRAVGVLADAELPAGEHHLDWDASRLAPGVHFLRLETPDAERALRVVTLR